MLPNVLVISNDPFSKENANGRTLGNFFLDYPKNQLAQLFINDAPLDFIDCSYFQISDQNLLDHFTKFRSVGQIRKYSAETPSFLQNNHPSVKKNPWTCLLRDRLWKTKAWSTKRLWSWIDAFKPAIVFLQAGDMPYLYDLALIIAKKTQSKLVIYNSEDYYFKTWNYMLDESGHKNLYPRFHKRFCKAFEKAMAHVSLCIYNSEYLQQDYRKAFPDNKSEVLYTLSTWTPTPYVPKEGRFQVTYFGNISDGRTDSLIDVANALSNLDKPYSFDVYGPVGREKDLQKLQSCPLLHYHQSIPYEQVRKLAEDSDLLIHIESFDPFIARDRKNAFSTKIMDCLASGRPFLLYAPKEMAESRFLQEKGLADCANSNENLEDFLFHFPASKSELQENQKTFEINQPKMSEYLSGLY